MITWRHITTSSTIGAYNGLLLVKRGDWRGALPTTNAAVLHVQEQQSGALVTYQDWYTCREYTRLCDWSQFAEPPDYL